MEKKWQVFIVTVIKVTVKDLLYLELMEKQWIDGWMGGWICG